MTTIQSKALLAASLLLTACSGSSSDSTFAAAKVDFTQALGASTFLPVHQDTAAQLMALAAEAADLQITQDGTELAQAQQAWRDARASWSRSEALLFWTLDDLGFASRMDAWDVDLVGLEALIAGADPIDANFVELQGAQLKGFHVVEYLLFGDAPGAVAPLAALQADARRADYLAAAAEDLNLRMAEAVVVAANMDMGFQVASNAEARLAVDKLVNHMLLTVELLADRGLGRPLGNTLGGIPQTPGVESPFAMSSLEDLQADLDGIRALWLGSLDGSAGPGIKSIAQATSPEIINQIESGIAAVQASLDGITGPLTTAMAATPLEIEAAFDDAKDLGQLIYVVLMESINVTIYASPFDGD